MPAESHSLAPLLTPRRIALVGASAKPDSVGQGIIKATAMPGTPAEIFLVNPAYREIEGRRCHARIADIEGGVDMAVFAVANERLEAALIDAIEAGVRAATIFASGHLADDLEPQLPARIAARAREAGMVICGGNCMGFYNLAYGLRVCGFPPPPWLRSGGAVLLTHSGSVFSALCHNDRRLGWSLVVSSGQELTTSIADYLDFALATEGTRCVGIFMETVRNPDGFTRALAKANAMDVPVIILKVGKTQESALRAVSHSGAVAGNHAAYRALFDRHNAIEVENLDDFANALRLHSGPRRIGSGGLASLHDSGGLLELAIDRAKHHHVRFAGISAGTKSKLAARLDPGLEATNPLDAWGTGRDYVNALTDMMRALLDDPDTAIGMMCAETRDGYYLSEGYATVLQRAMASTSKPVIIASNFGSHGNDGISQALTEAGIPSLSGVDSALSVIGKSLRRVARRAVSPAQPNQAPEDLRRKWRTRLTTEVPLNEDEGLALVGDYGLSVPARRAICTSAELLSAASEIPGPWALKTAAPGIHHKTDVGGVVLDLRDEPTLCRAYEAMAARLGPQALLASMHGGGIEMALGGLADSPFGPLVMIGAGGEFIELFRERAVALSPIDRATALVMIEELPFQSLLDGRRGREPSDRIALAEALAALSVLMADLGDMIAEIDINPILVKATGCVVLDALVVPRRKAQGEPWT